MTLYPIDPKDGEDQEERPFIRRISPQTWAFLGICVLIILVNLVAGLSSQPRLCGLCHYRQYAAWERSVHSGGGCQTCHRRPGLLGMASQRLEVLGMVSRTPLSFLNRSLTATIDNKACLQCHPTVTIKLVSANGIRMSHSEPDKDNYRCADCHGTKIHGGTSKAKRQYTMESCLACHDGDQNDQCQKCHVGRAGIPSRISATAWQQTHGKNWRRLHGMGDVNTCDACHRHGDFCRRCHGTEMPHTSSWLNLHGDDAKKNPKACKVCHKEESFCDSCHGLKMPHGEWFLAEHSQKAEKLGQKACTKCHQTEGCKECHERHAHPGVPKEKIESLRRRLGLDS